MASIFETLNGIDVSKKIEKKNGLSYLSWAWAWAEVKKVVPDATYTVYERDTATGPVNYYTDGRTCWVKTGVTLNGLEHIEELPVMDYKNRSIPLEAVTSMDVNKAIQRSLTKACARHGLGLYIYQGEDLPEEVEKAPEPAPRKSSLAAKVEKTAKASKKLPTTPEVMELRERMEKDAIPDRELEKYLVGKKMITAGTAVEDYPIDCVTQFLLPKWDAIAKKIKADPEYTPF